MSQDDLGAHRRGPAASCVEVARALENRHASPDARCAQTPHGPRLRHARAGLDALECEAFDDLVFSVWSGSRALSRRSRPSPEIVAAIAAMARWHADFVRSPHTFVGTSSSPIGAIRDLAEHLFALFPVPSP